MERSTSSQRCTHIEDVQVVVDQVFHDLDLVFALPVRLEQAGSEEQRQVLGAHLVQVGALLDPERRQETRDLILMFHDKSTTNTSGLPSNEIEGTFNLKGRQEIAHKETKHIQQAAQRWACAKIYNVCAELMRKPALFNEIMMLLTGKNRRISMNQQLLQCVCWNWN